MNTYSKYCPNVFLAKCTEKHEKGEVINVATKYGKENECIVHNIVYSKDGFFYYSIVRADGMNAQEYAKKRVERLAGYAANAESKSGEYYKKSNKDRDFLSLAEPIKVGHHSEKRHRKIIQQAWDNMGKSVEYSNKAEEYKSRAEYWQSRESIINLSMPESLEYFEYKVEEAKMYHEKLKSGEIELPHSLAMGYAKKAVNEFVKKLEIAKRLWK